MFLLEYIKNPRKVGAIVSISKYLAYEIIISYNNIVEYSKDIFPGDK